jgi:hypothetical protein
MQDNQQGIIDGGGILQGVDKKLSLRRILGLSLSILGMILLSMSLAVLSSFGAGVINMDNISIGHIVYFLIFLAPGSICLLFSAFIMRELTSQAISSIVNSARGQK